MIFIFFFFFLLLGRKSHFGLSGCYTPLPARHQAALCTLTSPALRGVTSSPAAVAFRPQGLEFLWYLEIPEKWDLWSSVWSRSFLREGLYDLHSCSQPCSLALSPSAMGTLSSPFLEDHVVEEQCWAISITEAGRTQGIADPGNSTRFIQQACSDPATSQTKLTARSGAGRKPIQVFIITKTLRNVSKWKGELLHFTFTTVKVAYQSPCVFLNHPSQSFIVQRGFSPVFHK